jgi:acyl-CoA synthetase (AMP-forming)/AMP-acid ligase II
VVTQRETETLAELIALRAAVRPGSTFLEDARSDRSFTFARFADSVAAWSNQFDELGLPSGAAVVIAVRDSLAFAVVHLAAISHGLRSVPINPALPDGEPARSADLIGVTGLIVVGSELALPEIDGWSSASVGLSGLPERVIRPSRPAGTVGELVDGGAAVLFTSGSTGTPKGVELPEKQRLFVAAAVAGNNRLSERDRGFNSLPLFHVNAEVVALLASLVAGSTIVFDESFHRTGFWELMLERRITWLNAVPAILAVLTRDSEPIPPEVYADGGLRFVRSASAPLPDGVRTALHAVPLVLSWGMTEGASQITATPIGDTAHAGSVGRPLGAEVQVRGIERRALPSGEIGALWIRGEGIVTSYLFGRASDRFDEDGWLNTGDLGSVDADGFVYLAGRSDDVINRGGEKVYPAEVEEVLLSDPRVLEAVVVARADDILGSVPVAYVIPVTSGSGSATAVDGPSLIEALRERCETGLPRFKRPVEIALVPDLPRAPTGKVQRGKVRELAAQ